jgi:hypothetical protein
MLRPTDAWAEFERADELATYRDMSYAEALERFERLWRHARALNPALGDDWREDLMPALAVARAINGLPPG